MPLVASALQSQFEATILQGLNAQLGSDFADQHQKLAKAISGIAMDIVTAITTQAMVVPGQAVVGTFQGVGSGPIEGATVSPGNIL